MSADLFLSSIVPDPTLDIQDPLPQKGKFFSITLIEATELTRDLLIPLSNLSPLPPMIALKIPLLEGDVNSPSNKGVFTSMATELQILRDEDIYNHENIVTLLGVCWQACPDEQILPVFVMEAAEMGNLETFLSERTLSLVEQVGLCIEADPVRLLQRSATLGHRCWRPLRDPPVALKEERKSGRPRKSMMLPALNLFEKLMYIHSVSCSGTSFRTMQSLRSWSATRLLCSKPKLLARFSKQ
jgi:hypothetical protein